MSRTMLVWCPDWPVLAAEIVADVPAFGPVAVVAANRVVACSEAARAEGVRRGLRKREAQSRCPQLVVIDHDPGRDARAFEPVVIAVEELAPGVEVVRPGACALAARGPSRYFGSEEAAAERIVEQVAQACQVEAQIGVADGVFAAGLAARAGQLVPPGRTAEFLSDFDVSTVERPDLVDLLRRLGIRTLGQFAGLPAADVLARFGTDAALVHRLAAGLDLRPLAVRKPPPDLDVTQTFDEPLERVDAAAFAGRQLAERLHERLAGHGLACTRLAIVATTGPGEELHRTWRHDGLLSAAAIADRVRWQLDGWLTGTSRTGRGAREGRPSGGIIRLRLIPDGVVGHAGFQLGLWGDAGADRERAHRAFHRVQGLLGPEAVVTPVRGGGRDPADQVRFVPWGDERLPTRPAGPPWPGQLLPPYPAAILVEPLPVRVVDAEGWPVGVTARLMLTAAPAALTRTAPPSHRGMGDQPPGRAMDDRPAHSAQGGDRAARLAQGGDRAARSAEGGDEVSRAERPASRVAGDGSARVSGGQSAGLAQGGGRSRHLVPVPDQPVEEAGRGSGVVGWAGPWPADERWWAPGEASRRVRFQVSLADGRAVLLLLEAGNWSVTAIYD